MKKFFALLTVIALLCTVAFAAEIAPMAPAFTMADDHLEDGAYRVAFLVEDIEADHIFLGLADQDLYDVVEVMQMQEGDTIVAYGKTFTVETINEDDGSIEINGGSDMENGVTLYAGEGGTYYTMNYEIPCYTIYAEVEMPLAATVTLNHFVIDEEGGVSDQMASSEVAAADLRAAFEQLPEEQGFSDAYMPEQASIDVVNDTIVAITINYIP